jgi:hypothetical protein
VCGDLVADDEGRPHADLGVLSEAHCQGVSDALSHSVSLFKITLGCFTVHSHSHSQPSDCLFVVWCAFFRFQTELDMKK